jgi:hypothetical protein
MFRRLARRSTALAAAATLAFAGSAFADSIAADGDQLSGVQNVVDLGTAAPGETIERDVNFVLSCAGLRHVDPGQVVTVAQAGSSVPVEGGSITATSTTVGPVPQGWANDTLGIAGCNGPMSVQSNAPSHVTVVAPSVPGVDYAFSIDYGKLLTPAGVSDGTSLTGFTMITFVVDVADVGPPPDTTPPSLVGLPADLDVVTGDPAGTILAYTPPTATDDIDPAPTVLCDPAPGAVAAIGTTFVTCTASDASGNVSVGSFWVTVRHGQVAWDDPVQDTGVVATRGRTLPVKVRAWLDGEAVMGGGKIEVWSCGPGATLERTLDAGQSDAGRWMAGLDTSGLAVGCHAVSLVVDGTSLGSFTMNLVDPPAGDSTKGKTRPG